MIPMAADSPVSMCGDDLRFLVTDRDELKGVVAVHRFFTPSGVANTVHFVADDHEALTVPCSWYATRTECALDSLVHCRTSPGCPPDVTNPHGTDNGVLDRATSLALTLPFRDGRLLVTWALKPFDD